MLSTTQKLLLNVTFAGLIYSHGILRTSNFVFHIVGFSCLKHTLKKVWTFKGDCEKKLGNNVRLITICLLLHEINSACIRTVGETSVCKPWIGDYQWSFQGKASKYPHSFMQVNIHKPLAFLAWMCKLAKIEKSNSCCSFQKRRCFQKRRWAQGFNPKDMHLIYEGKLDSRKLKWDIGLKCYGESQVWKDLLIISELPTHLQVYKEGRKITSKNASLL